MNIGTVILAVSAVWLASEIFLARFRRSKSSDNRLDNSSMRIIWIAIAISVGIGVFLGSGQFGYFGGGSIVVHIVGIAFIVSGIVVRWVAILTLKRQFTVDVAITEGHQLVTHGIYHWLRHPSYSGSLLSFLGLGLAFANYMSILAIFVPVCVAFLHRMRIEERVLINKFGVDYLKYRDSTKRLIPYLY